MNFCKRAQNHWIIAGRDEYEGKNTNDTCLMKIL